jgi:hypothetical protein
VADFLEGQVSEQFEEAVSEDEVEVEDPYNMQHNRDDASQESSSDDDDESDGVI